MKGVSRTLPTVGTVLDVIQHKEGITRSQVVGGVVFPRVRTKISALYKAMDGRTIAIIAGCLIDEVLVPMNDETQGCEVRYFRRERDAQAYWLSQGERILGEIIEENKEQPA